VDLNQLIQTYGYLALFIGTFLEGETILIVAGFAAFNGTLDITLAILTAFAGSFAGDQLAFYVGRFKGDWLVHKFRRWQAKVDKVHCLMLKHQVLLILGFRFCYGLRNLTPFAVGTTSISPLRFFSLNAIGAIVWAISFGLGGYFLGNILETLLKDVKQVQLFIIGLIVLAALALWVVKLIRKNGARKAQCDTPKGPPPPPPGQSL